MKYTIITLLTFITLSTWSCKKDTLENIDQIDFGYYNFAWGAYCQRYELTPENLFTTSMACDPRDTAVLVYDLDLSIEKFGLAKRLFQDLPEEIFNNGKTSFETGCADCGGYYLQIKKGDVIKSVYFTEGLNEDWPSYARKAYRLLANTVDDLR